MLVPQRAREAQHLREARDRQDAGHDRRADAGRRAAVAETQERVAVVEELRDRPGRAGVDLAAQVVEIGRRRGRLGMHLRIGRHGDVERRHAASPATRSEA